MVFNCSSLMIITTTALFILQGERRPSLLLDLSKACQEFGVVRIIETSRNPPRDRLEQELPRTWCCQRDLESRGVVLCSFLCLYADYVIGELRPLLIYWMGMASALRPPSSSANHKKTSSTSTTTPLFSCVVQNRSA